VSVLHSVGAKPAVLRRIFKRVPLESSEVRGGAEIIGGSLIISLVFRSAFYRFVLNEISHWVIAFKNYPMTI
jgi:hypothetical protein